MALRNEDFRKLLTTPRPGARPNLDAQAAEAGRDKKPRAPRPQRPKPRAGKCSKEELEAEDEAAYRDRAAERRKGDDNMEVGVPPSAGAVLGGVLGGAAQAFEGFTYDESKFLGGDIDHTHLVKGLDFALLNKIKSEQAAARRGSGHEASAAAAAQDEGPGAAPAAPAVPREVTFKSTLGSSVHEFFFGAQRRIAHGAVAEQFLPRRTAFVFELDDPFASDVPTTLRRSRDDCPAVKEKILAGLDGAVLERMAKIMAYMALSGGGRKKLKKKERQELLQRHGLSVQGALKGEPAPPAAPEAPPVPAGPVDEEEDIFGDAGTEYVVERRQPEGVEEGPALPAPAAGGKRSYFGGDQQGGEAAELELGPALPPGHGAVEGYPEAEAYPDTDAAYAAAEAEAAAEAQRERELDEKRKRLLADDADDGYAECYPAYHDMAGTAYDSEDDDGKGAAKAEPAEGVAGEAAAGGEGGEAGGAKGGGRDAARREAIKARMKQTTKLSSELGKIKDIFSEKGYEHGTAFDKSRREGKEGKAGGSDRAEAEEPVLTMPTKRRRI